MTAWMLFAVIVAAALTAAGLLVDRGLALMGRPSRWLWLLVMAASAGWPFIPTGALGGLPESSIADAVSAGAAMLEGVAGASTKTWVDVTTAIPDSLPLGAWAIGSAILVIVLLLSADTLKQDRRRWRTGMVAGEPVFLSGWIGPAVVGTFEARIVLPRWMLELDESIQQLIVLHEREHVRAGDHRLLTTALLILVIFPWCVPLWWQFRRLRSAVETDCDSRVLKAGAPARDYAHTLVTVADRRRRMLFPLPAAAQSRAALERRIRRILAAPARGRERMAFGLIVAAAVVSVAAVSVPVPDPPSLTALAASLRASAPGMPNVGPPLPSGALSGDPGQERLAAEIRNHHSAAIASGLPEESVIWFIADPTGAVARTGIERGADREVEASIRARYPAETSDYSLGWSDVPTGEGEVSVVWILPPPP